MRKNTESVGAANAGAAGASAVGAGIARSTGLAATHSAKAVSQGSSAPRNQVPDPNWLLDQLDPEQRAVARQLHGSLCVKAGAGTGKTRAITYRIAYGAALGAFDPGQVLAVTFTRKSAAEMQSRLRSLGVGRAKAKTFHSAALHQLRYFWPRMYRKEFPEVRDSKAPLVQAAATQMELETSKASIADLCAEIQWAKVMMFGPDRYEQQASILGREAPAGLTVGEFAELFDLYQQLRRERGMVDFEDILLLTVGMLRTNDEAARLIRRRYSRFVVDEYQDVSPVQHALLNLWLGERRDLCAVGDASQTIYSFSGASSDYLVNFEKYYQGAKTIELYRNYRSTPQIVGFANRVIVRAAKSKGTVRLVSQQEPGAVPTVRSYVTNQEEAADIAQTIQKLLAAGIPAPEIAVLVRTNSQTLAFETALSQAGISYQVRGGEDFFKREEIRRSIVFLRRFSLLQRIGESEPLSLVEMVEQAATEQGWSKQPPATRGVARERWENLEALVNFASTSSHRTLDDFLAELAERSEAKAAPTLPGVVLTTLHTAKGLEWEAVFLAGLSDGLMPIAYAETEAAREEERRLFYVGTSRAKTHLQFSWAEKVSADRNKTREPSPFLVELFPREITAWKTRKPQK